MQVTITSAEDFEGGKYFSADCGKTSAHIYISKFGYINVCCKNASHKVWNKSGSTSVHSKKLSRVTNRLR